MKNLLPNSKIIKVSATVSTGTSAVVLTAVDTLGYEGVMFLASIGSANAGNGIKVQQGQASGMGDASDLAGSAVMSDGTQTDLVADVYQPLERYVRCVVIRAGTTTTVEAVWAILYGPRTVPVTNVTAAQAAEFSLSPDEGTA